ncbi:O-antigen ligase family protein, partial [Pseudorhodoplanes sp.]|uniref:O-antigen ligase family protein n=1 Tax=Pseudorhodoplanes sp. TaxID=1934341 RepID=UPI003919F4C2
MITLDQAQAMAAAARSAPAAGPARRVPAVAVGLLHGALFLTILGSFLVFIEPSPYEVLSALLVFTCFLAGVTFDRKLLPLVILLLLYNLGGAFSLIPVIGDEPSRRFILISFYMAVTAIVFAMIFSADCVRRAELLRTAYILAGVCAAIAGIAGYFTGSELLTLYGRARGTFKDPNVYGPFLILPMLFLLQSFLAKGLRVVSFAAFMIMAAGLFLSFSRAAWAHMVFSAVMMMALLFMTTPSGWFRARLVAFSVMVSLAIAGLLAGLLAVGNVGDVFKERASLNQYYDVGESGRFGNQKKSVNELLELPNGFGPLQFRNHYGNDPHQVYLNAFASYGWLGGFSYLALVLLTLLIGLRTVFVATPWQRYFIPVMATFT